MNKRVLKKKVKRALKVFGLYNYAVDLKSSVPSLRMIFWNFGYRVGGANDELPIPSAKLIDLVAGSKEISWFLRGGEMGRQSQRVL